MRTIEKKNIVVDVVVLGGSLAATVTALALSSKGLSVALLDRGQHPRFGLGESLLKPTVYWMRLLAFKYQLPQLDILANLDKIHTTIGPTSGIKKCFGFLQHRAGEESIKNMWWSSIPISYEEDISEAHLFRQDVDSYLFNECVKSCHLVMPGVDISAIDVGASGVSLCADNNAIEAKYIIDATSANSLLANQFDLRDSPTRLKTQSRTIFTHMINVRKYDECPAANKAAINWHEGTLHHLVEEGWIWVIPFDNHPRSKNSLVSVGMTFINQTEKSNITAEQEWACLLDKYPVLKQQFSQAKPVRPWISTGKLQYSSKQATGERYCLLGASYGGVDALFSRGILNTLQSIYLTVDKVTTACQQNDFNNKNFTAIDDLQANSLEINDLLTFGNYCASGSTRLTTWWLSIWTLVEQHSVQHVYGSLLEAMDDPELDWKGIDQRYSAGQAISNQDMLLSFLREAVTSMELYKDGDIDQVQVDSQLRVLASPFQDVGFTFEGYESLLTEFGFNSSARTMLQTEHNLVYLLEVIDSSLQSAEKLRKRPLLKYVVRLLTNKIYQEKRKSRKKSSALVLEFKADALNQLLTDIESKWSINQPNHSAEAENISKIYSLNYRSQPIQNSIIRQEQKRYITMQSIVQFKDIKVQGEVFLKEITGDKIECVVIAEDNDSYQTISLIFDSCLLGTRE